MVACGWLRGPRVVGLGLLVAAWASEAGDGELGRLVVEGRLGRLSWFSFFFFISLLLYLNSNLIWNLNSKIGVPYWSFRYEAHNILLYIY